jgi:hypothetical protein
MRVRPNVNRRLNLPVFLRQARVHGNAGEVALAEKSVKLRAASSTLDEDDDLVELELIEQVVELAVLLALAEANIVLLQSVQRQLGVVVDVQLKRVLHELLADRARCLRERGAEHHDLLLGRRGPEDLLDVAAHVCFGQMGHGMR